MDMLVWLKRSLQPLVNFFRLNKLASPVFRQLLTWRYRQDALSTATQNGRTWKIHPEVALRGEFQEFDTVLWLRDVIKPGSTVIDVGANVGQMTLEAAELTGPSGKVIAIEPAPGNYRILQLHITGNQFTDRVSALQAACGSKHGGEIILNIYGNETNSVGSGHNTVNLKNHEEGITPLRVPLVSIDGLCQEKQIVPQVIKIDVEGAELEVIRGAVQTLKAYQPEVQIGFHPFAFKDVVQATRELIELFRSCGYEVPAPDKEGKYELQEYQMHPRNNK